MMVGGISNQDEAATPEVHGLVQQVQGSVHGKLSKTFHHFEAVSYKTQVVAGRNYFIKVHVGDDNYVHLRVYRNLQQEVSLHSVQEGKTKEDAIEYF